MDPSNIDQRFQSVFHDKRFNSIRQKQRKVKIDRRFYSMFTDDRFKVSFFLYRTGTSTGIYCKIMLKAWTKTFVVFHC